MRKGWLAGCVAAAVAAGFAAATPADGSIAPRAYRDVSISLPADAALPPHAVVTDEAGRPREFGEMISRPRVLVFADYTCRTLCSPIVAFVAAALERTGLRASSSGGS
jgi:protein SCO1/2